MKLFLLAVSALSLHAQVPYERIAAASTQPANWLTYSGTYEGHRYSPLKQIDRTNVSRLKPAWMYQTNDLNPFEGTPLVADGVMYISEPPSNAAALDLRTGRPLWTFRRTIPSDVRACCGQVNRGLAILGETLYLGTLDAHLIALDMKTGHVLFDTTVADYKEGYSITVAPLALKDRIVVGMAGGEYGVRGFLDSYDPKSGARLWRFYTVPGPGEPGHESWKGDSWKQGSATTWVTGSYDPALNLLYWGTGNPGPDYDGDIRNGDDLYADSVLAIDASTGKLKWHFQFTPGDVHDWDSTHTPVLIDANFRGIPRKMLAVANRNGFFYLIDRQSGEFLQGKPYGKEIWAKGLDDRGRPILFPNMEPTPQGIGMYPGVHGATNWFSPSYSPDTHLFYVATREETTTYYRATSDYSTGNLYTAGGVKGVAGIEPSGSIQAIDPLTGDQRWSFALHSPPWSGVLSTAGGLIFGGTVEGNLFALDSSNGKPLWDFQAGAPAFSNPISYEFEGKQYFVMTSGHTLITFNLQ
jgi:alcohol dehydrogenase (cytochrome c)